MQLINLLIIDDFCLIILNYFLFMSPNVKQAKKNSLEQLLSLIISKSAAFLLTEWNNNLYATNGGKMDFPSEKQPINTEQKKNNTN